MFEQWLTQNFKIEETAFDDITVNVVIVTEYPERKTTIDTLVGVFSAVEQINYSSLKNCLSTDTEGNDTTGLLVVLDDWVNRGLIPLSE